MTWHSSSAHSSFDCPTTAARSIEDYHRRSPVPVVPPGVYPTSSKSHNPASFKSCYIMNATRFVSMSIQRVAHGTQKATQSQKRRHTKNRDSHLSAQQAAPLAGRGGGPYERRHP